MNTRVIVPMEISGGYVVATNDDHNVSFCLEQFKEHFTIGRFKNFRLILTTNSRASAEAYELHPSACDNTVWNYFEVMPDGSEEENSPWPYDFDYFLSKHFDRSSPAYGYLELGK